MKLQNVYMCSSILKLNTCVCQDCSLFMMVNEDTVRLMASGCGAYGCLQYQRHCKRVVSKGEQGKPCLRHSSRVLANLLTTGTSYYLTAIFFGCCLLQRWSTSPVALLQNFKQDMFAASCAVLSVVDQRK